MSDNIASTADQSTPQPRGTNEAPNQQPTGTYETAPGEEPFGTKGDTFERALEGTPPLAGAAPAAPATTQNEVSDCTSESGTSVRHSKRRGGAQRSASAQTRGKDKPDQSSARTRGRDRKGVVNSPLIGPEAQSDQARNWNNMTQDSDPDSVVSLAALGEDTTLSLAAQREEGEDELLAGGLDKKTFRTVAVTIGRILAELLPETAQIGDVLPGAAHIRELVEGIGSLSAENKQKFVAACVGHPLYYKAALRIMAAEAKKRNEAFRAQDSKRVKIGDSTREGIDKGISPNRDPRQVSADRNTAETTGETTFGALHDMVSTPDIQESTISFDWLKIGCHIDESVRQTTSDENYVGPTDLTWSMHPLYEQIRAVKLMYDTHGKILQPPIHLIEELGGERSAYKSLATEELWWVTKWQDVLAMPEHGEGGYIDGNKQVHTIYIQKTHQDAYTADVTSKTQTKQAFPAQGRTAQKRVHQEAQYAPAENLLNTPAHTQSEEAIQEPNALDTLYEEAMERAENLRQKMGQTQG